MSKYNLICMVWYRLEFNLKKNDGEHFDIDAYFNPVKEEWKYFGYEKRCADNKQSLPTQFLNEDNDSIPKQSKWAKQYLEITYNGIVLSDFGFSPFMVNKEGEFVFVDIPDINKYSVGEIIDIKGGL